MAEIYNIHFQDVNVVNVDITGSTSFKICACVVPKPVVSKWGSVVLAIFQNPGSSRANPFLEGQEI